MQNHDSIPSSVTLNTSLANEPHERPIQALSAEMLQSVSGGFSFGLTLGFVPRALPIGWVPLPRPIVW